MNNLPDKLIDALRESFTDTELHVFIIAAEHPDNRGASHWQRLRKAAIKAADCVQCAAGAR